MYIHLHTAKKILMNIYIYIYIYIYRYRGDVDHYDNKVLYTKVIHKRLIKKVIHSLFYSKYWYPLIAEDMIYFKILFGGSCVSSGTTCNSSFTKDLFDTPLER